MGIGVGMAVLELVAAGIITATAIGTLGAGAVAFSGVKIVKEYERGVKFRLGKLAGEMQPGPNYVLPLVESWKRVDTRIFTVPVQRAQFHTADSVPVTLDAVINYHVIDPVKAVLRIASPPDFIAVHGQLSLKKAVTEASIAKLLTAPVDVAAKARDYLSNSVSEWGFGINAVEFEQVHAPAGETVEKPAEAPAWEVEELLTGIEAEQKKSVEEKKAELEELVREDAVADAPAKPVRKSPEPPQPEPQRKKRRVIAA
jgi:regulator of protease activity HflC (stomatin/prohibitin superfamily)